MNKIIIFTNSFPYGSGETFFRSELPFLSKKFDEIIIFPLYIPKDETNAEKARLVSDNNGIMLTNVKIYPPLLSFHHKNKFQLILKGLITSKFTSRYSLGSRMAIHFKEFFKRKVYLSGRKLWIFFNYTFLIESILADRKRMREVEKELAESKLAYFYWGDKSALMIPYLKERLNGVGNKPKFVVRFHGSDVYESAKGYLPYREGLYKSIDLAVPISNNGAEYIKTGYKSQAADIKVFRLGSFDVAICREYQQEESTILRIVSCSNVIELKRVGLIADAIKIIVEDESIWNVLQEKGYSKVEWTHFGDGPLLDGIKNMFKEEPKKGRLTVNFVGRKPNSEILKSYSNTQYDLFVQVSRSEGIPVSIMEAYSCGIPVVATNVGGVGELFNTTPKDSGQKNTGFLLEQNISSKQLCQVICTYVQMPFKDKINMRKQAKLSWENDWNAAVNYEAFANELKSQSL